MNKREFLKASGSMMAGALLSRMGVGQAHKEAAAKANRTNWAGNYTYKAARLDEPGSAQEVQRLVTSLSNAKALGARHSFNDIADSSGDQISLKNMTEMTLDKAAGTVTVAAGVTYGKLAPWLDAQGFAVHNLASLPHVSVVGACATATHGSGVHNGNLSTAVRAIEFVDGTGQLTTLSRAANDDEFNGAVVGLGALGVITRITLAVVP
ncbi:MAG: FAD-binding protein, partial [Acidobacteriaceae bacterium]|nr:FAD-binding protein [Acidobacteriaceae bacterium]